MRIGDERWWVCWASRATAVLAFSTGCGSERTRFPSEGPPPLEPSEPAQLAAQQPPSSPPGSAASPPLDPVRGGQSGTEEGEGAGEACPTLQDVQGTAMDVEQYAWELGAPPLEVARQVLGTQAAGSGEDRVVLELNEFLGARKPPVGACYPLVFDFQGRAFAGERLLLDGTITLAAWNGPMFMDWAYATAEGSGVLRVTLRLALNGSGVSARAASLHQPGVPDVFPVTYEWDVAAQRRRPPELDQPCAAVRGAALDPESLLSFASPEEASAALEGTWVTCDGNENDTFAGMVIHDGHWHHLVRRGDGFEAQRGFEHEGDVELISFPSPDDPQSLRYRIYPLNPWGGALGLSPFPEGLRGSRSTWDRAPDSVSSLWTTSLIRMPVAVSEPTLPQAPNGAAGESACASGESSLLDVTSSNANPVLPLVGRWQRCSGPFPELLEFDAQGMMRMLSENGEVLQESDAPLEFQAALPGAPQVMMFTSYLNRFRGKYTALFSETPRKLWLGTTESYFGQDPVTYYEFSFSGVYSALP